MNTVYQFLDYPPIYRLARKFLAPGAKASYKKTMEELIATLPPAELLLDVGCGPSSLLFTVGKHPIGLDPTMSYVAEFTAKNGEKAVAASAEIIPFATHSFDAAWSIAVYHHLPTPIAERAIREMMRVTKPGGYVVVIDGVLPRISWQRPIAAITRRLDRGRFMRNQLALEALLPERDKWAISRKTYTLTGMEMLICYWLKPITFDQQVGKPNSEWETHKPVH